MQGSGAEPVLAAHQLLLVLPGIAPHEQPVCGLVTRVGGYCLLPELNGYQELAAIAVCFCEVLERLQVQLLEMPPFRKIPFTFEIVLEERPAIKLDGGAAGVEPPV